MDSRDRKRQRRYGNLEGERYASNVDSFGAVHLKKMGWNPSEKPTNEVIKVKRQKEGQGLGSSSSSVPTDAWIDNVSGFSGLLQKLNQVYGDEAQQQQEEQKVDDVVSTKKVGVLSSKRLKNKTMKNFSQKDIKEIMGGCETTKKKHDTPLESVYDGMFVKASKK